MSENFIAYLKDRNALIEKQIADLNKEVLRNKSIIEQLEKNQVNGNSNELVDLRKINWEIEVAKLMLIGTQQGITTFTRKYLALSLENKYKLYHHEAMHITSSVFIEDKRRKEKRFRSVRHGHWELIKKSDVIL